MLKGRKIRSRSKMREESTGEDHPSCNNDKILLLVRSFLCIVSRIKSYLVRTDYIQNTRSYRKIRLIFVSQMTKEGKSRCPCSWAGACAYLIFGAKKCSGFLAQKSCVSYTYWYQVLQQKNLSAISNLAQPYPARTSGSTTVAIWQVVVCTGGYCLQEG